MYYSYKDCEILVDNSPIHANSLEVSLSSSISPTFLGGKSLPDYYVPEDGIKGSAKVLYYVTGSDFLRDYLSDDTRFLDLNLGGLKLKSGVVNSYSINGQPNSPVQAEAEIVFFGDIEGQFSTVNKTNRKINFINFSECLISGSNLGDLSNVNGFSYRAIMDVESSYKDSNITNNITPNMISFGRQQVLFNLDYDNITGEIPISGKDAQVFVKRGNIDIIPSISGKIVSRNISVKTNDIIRSSVSIRQDTIVPPPEIYGFYPESAEYAGQVRISGANIKTLKQILYADKPVNFFSFRGESVVQINILHRTPISGQFTLLTQGGSSKSTGYFQIGNNIPSNF